jgi:hypothetical protein
MDNNRKETITLTVSKVYVPLRISSCSNMPMSRFSRRLPITCQPSWQPVSEGHVHLVKTAHLFPMTSNSYNAQHHRIQRCSEVLKLYKLHTQFVFYFPVLEAEMSKVSKYLLLPKIVSAFSHFVSIGKLSSSNSTYRVLDPSRYSL